MSYTPVKGGSVNLNPESKHRARERFCSRTPGGRENLDKGNEVGRDPDMADGLDPEGLCHLSCWFEISLHQPVFE